MKNYKNLFLLNNLTDMEKMNIIKSFSEPKNFKKNEIIYTKGIFNNAIGYFIKGKARVIADNNSDVVLQRFSAGDSFGAAAIFSKNESYVSTIIAETDCLIQFINEEEIKNIFISYPKSVINYISFLSEKIRFLNEKISIVSCSTAEEKVLKYLINLRNEDGFSRLPENMTIISKILGIGRASLYRSLELLEKNGLIIKINNKYKVNENEKNS